MEEHTPTSIDKAMYRIMAATDVYYQKQQSGWLTHTPPEYVDAKTLKIRWSHRI